MYNFFSLVCNRSLNILVKYVVGPQVIRLLRKYWYQLNMVAQAGGVYGTPFKVFCRVTQGCPLSPTISNVVVDAVLLYWVTVVVSMEEAVDPGAAGTKSFSQYVQRLAAYFYADNGILVLAWATQLQWRFHTLMELFYHMGLRVNVAKTVIITYQTFRALGGHST